MTRMEDSVKQHLEFVLAHPLTKELCDTYKEWITAVSVQGRTFPTFDNARTKFKSYCHPYYRQNVLSDYHVVCDTSNNHPAAPDFVADVALKFVGHLTVHLRFTLSGITLTLRDNLGTLMCAPQPVVL